MPTKPVPAIAVSLLIAATLTNVVPAMAQGKSIIEISRGDSESTVDGLNFAIGMNPQNPKLYYKRGISFYFQGNYKLAAGDFERAAELDGTDCNHYLWLGKTYAMLANDPQSIHAYVRALEVNPGLLSGSETAGAEEHTKVETGPGAPMKLAATHKNGNGKDERSIRNYLVAVGIVRDHKLARFVGGTTFSGIERPEFPQDGDHAYLRPDNLDQIITSPEDVMKRYKQVLAERDKSTTDADLARAHFFRALACEQLGDDGKAMTELKQALQIDSTQPQFFLARALVYHAHKDDVLANRDIEKAQQLDLSLPKSIAFPSEWEK